MSGCCRRCKGLPEPIVLALTGASGTAQCARRSGYRCAVNPSSAACTEVNGWTQLQRLTPRVLTSSAARIVQDDAREDGCPHPVIVDEGQEAAAGRALAHQVLLVNS
jgi:hypothetical protein